MAAIILYSTSSYIQGQFNGDEFNKEFISRDLGLAIDVLSFSPESIEMNYNLTKEFMIESRKSNLRIKSKDIEIAKEYNFISKVNDFSIKSNNVKIKDNKIS